MNLPVPFPNCYWVTPGAFLAGEYPGDSDSVAANLRLGALLNAGIRTFIDLTEEEEINENAKPVPPYWGTLKSLAGDRRIEITYLRIPIPDRGIPSVWTMRCVLDVVDRSINDENGVYVHCWAGRGRTGTVVGCYLKRHELATDINVVDIITEKRRLMPIGHASSPHTPHQVRFVKNWKTAA